MASLNRFAAATALAAAFSMAATPAMARDYHHHWHRWHRDRIDGGDVLAGALILGGIAAVASAASKADRTDRETSSPPPPADDRQGYADGSAERDVGPDRDEALDRAADLCAKAVDNERDRVDFVDNVTSDRDGWSVSGALVGGSGFSCRVGNDGRVADVKVGGPRAEVRDDGYSDGAPPAAQDDDNGSSDVRGDGNDAHPGVDNRPVWHGDDSQPQGQPEPQDDGRYDTSQAPDFGQSA